MRCKFSKFLCFRLNSYKNFMPTFFEEGRHRFEKRFIISISRDIPESPKKMAKFPAILCGIVWVIGLKLHSQGLQQYFLIHLIY
jgi:hypothetical protein